MSGPIDDSKWDLKYNEANPGIRYMESDAYCTENRVATDCLAVCSIDDKNTDLNAHYIYKVASTEGYENISLTFNVDPYGIENVIRHVPPESCSIWYSIDNQINNWTQIGHWDEYDHIIGHTVYLNHSASNNTGVAVKIIAIDHDTDCCYVSNISLNGQTMTFISPSERTIIWEDHMRNASGWSIVGDPLIKQINGSTQCVWRGSNSCWCVSGYSTNSRNTGLYRIASTIGYENISLSFNLETTSSTAECSLWYNINNETSDWMFVDEWNGAGYDVSDIVYLNKSTWDNEAVGIRILASHGGDACC